MRTGLGGGVEWITGRQRDVWSQETGRQEGVGLLGRKDRMGIQSRRSCRGFVGQAAVLGLGNRQAGTCGAGRVSSTGM